MTMIIIGDDCDMGDRQRWTQVAGQGKGCKRQLENNSKQSSVSSLS